MKKLNLTNSNLPLLIPGVSPDATQYLETVQPLQGKSDEVRELEIPIGDRL